MLESEPLGGSRFAKVASGKIFFKWSRPANYAMVPRWHGGVLVIAILSAEVDFGQHAEQARRA